MNILRVFLVSLLYSGSVWAANIEDLSDKVSLNLLVLTPEQSFVASPIDNEDLEVNYKPNTGNLSGFEFTHKWLSFSYVTLSEEDAETAEFKSKGNTSFDDIRLGIFWGDDDQFLISGRYTRYRGFYIENTQDIDPGNSDYILFPFLETNGYGGRLIYVTDPDSFSAPAFFTRATRQRSSGGSWMFAGAAENATIHNGDNSIFPSVVQSEFGDDSDLEAVRFDTLTASVGYGHSFVWNESYYLTLAFMAGSGLQKRTTYKPTGSETAYDNSSRYRLMAGFGINYPSFYTGISGFFEGISFATGDTNFEAQIAAGQVFIGGRFGAPGFFDYIF